MLGTVNFGTDYGIANKAGQVDRFDLSKILQTVLQAGIKTLVQPLHMEAAKNIRICWC